MKKLYTFFLAGNGYQEMLVSYAEIFSDILKGSNEFSSYEYAGFPAGNPDSNALKVFDCIDHEELVCKFLKVFDEENSSMTDQLSVLILSEEYYKTLKIKKLNALLSHNGIKGGFIVLTEKACDCEKKCKEDLRDKFRTCA